MLLEAMAAVAAALTAAGARAVVDPRDLNPPGVLVVPPTMTFRYADGSWAADWQIYAVAPNAGTGESLAALDVLIGQVRAGLSGAPVTATPSTLTVDGQADPLPAFQISWTERIRPTPA